MRVFISGRIVGASHSELMRFFSVEKMLEAKGYEVYNPANRDCFGDWQKRLGIDLPQLESCDAIYMIQGYKAHVEPQVELTVAKNRNLIIMHQSTDDYADALDFPINEVQRILGIGDLRAQVKNVEYTAARAIIATYCKERLSMNRYNIGHVVGRKPCSIYNMLYSYENWMKSWPEFRVWVSQFKNAVKW